MLSGGWERSERCSAPSTVRTATHIYEGAQSDAIGMCESLANQRLHPSAAAGEWR
jgi:hypothetical protein